MARIGFCGPTYQSISPLIDAEFAMNLYLEAPESTNAQTSMALIGTPGLSLFCDLHGRVSRGGITFNGRAWEVVDGSFWEMVSAGGATGVGILRGTIANDQNPVSMVAGNSTTNQILIASAGITYTYDLTSNAVTPVAALSAIVISQVDFSDGFYLALVANSNEVMQSNPLDATTWNGAAVGEVSVFPDNLVGMKVLHREIWLQGIRASTVYDDQGSSPFAFGENPSAGVIEMGLAAQWSQVILDNTLFWLGQDSRGGRMVWRASGYTPQRVSTFALERIWNAYSTVSDAIAYGYQEEGHSFYVLRFPTANATFVYDVAVGQWHQRGQWDGSKFNAHPSQNHIYAFGLHLVGDPTSGKIYAMSLANLQDNGVNIRRLRRSPTVSNEQLWIFHEYLQIYMETGLMPAVPLFDGGGQSRPPVVNLRWSDDGGHTWGNWYQRSVGKTGEYRKRVIWRRLGRSRERIYELEIDDPIPVRIVDAYLEATGFQVPTKRLTEQLRAAS